MGEELKDFDINSIPYLERYQTIDGVRWVMLKEVNENIHAIHEAEIKELEAELEALRCPWVSVEDRLPEDDNMVVVRLYDPDDESPPWSDEPWVYYDADSYNGEWGLLCSDQITHWMKIPPLQESKYGK